MAREPWSPFAPFSAIAGERRSVHGPRRRSLSRARQAIGGEDELGMDRDPRRIRPAHRLLSAVDGLRVVRPNEPKLGLWQPAPPKYIKARRNTRTRFWRRLGAIHRALDLVTRGFFGLFARGFPGFLGASGGTCTNRPNRGGTAAALTIGPAATSLFRRESTCRFSPPSARAPSSWRSPRWAKTTSSTVSVLSTLTKHGIAGRARNDLAVP